MARTAFALITGIPAIPNYNTRMLKFTLGKLDCASRHIPALWQQSKVFRMIGGSQESSRRVNIKPTMSTSMSPGVEMT